MVTFPREVEEAKDCFTKTQVSRYVESEPRDLDPT